jgi:hypothetical protein
VPGRIEAEEKSPLIAELLAIFPGILIHGLGNLYAGKTDRAGDLMAEEGIGIAAMGVGAGLCYLGYAENGHSEHSHGWEKIDGRIEEVSEFAGGGAAGIFGTAFFFDSWIEDMLEAPGAAIAHNKRVRALLDESIRPIAADPIAPVAPVITAGAPSQSKRVFADAVYPLIAPDPAAPVMTPNAPSGRHP